MAATEPPEVPAESGNAITRGLVDAFHQVVDRHTGAKKEHLTDILETFERDLAPHIAAATAAARADPQTPEWIRELLNTASEPQNFTTSFLIGIAVAGILQPVLSAVLAPSVQALSNVTWHGAATTPGNPATIHITPNEAASAVLKGVFDETHGAGLAAYSGTSAQDFDHLVQIAGQSIGIAEALLLWRRGQITDAHLDEIVRYSNVNPRFYGDVRLLRYGPPPAGEVVAGLLKGHLTQAEAATKLGHAGINPDELAWMRATAGRPPSPAEMVRLWHRGKATETDVEAAVRQSDINDDFMAFVKELGHWYPPPRSIMAMLRDGSIDDARGRQLFTYAGVPPDIQDDMLGEAHHSKGAQVKAITSAQVVRMYSTRLIDRPAANGKLIALRYTQADATLLLDFADDERHERILNATIGKVGTKYVAHRLSLADATHLLTTAGVPTAAQHDLVALWDVQREANVLVPSASAVVGAARRKQISPAETKARLLALGVQLSDMDIFVVDGWPPTQAADGHAAAAQVIAGDAAWAAPGGGTTGGGKHLTQYQILGLYSAGTITRAEARAQLIELGFTGAQADQLISLAPPPPGPKP